MADPPPITGVPTGAVAFLGVTERGPTSPQLVTNLADFAHLFGAAPAPDAYLAAAVTGFFENGGNECFVVRVADSGTVADFKAALTVLETDDFRRATIVHAPYAGPDNDAIEQAVVDHCSRMPFRFAVLDGPPEANPAGAYRPDIDSPNAALYWPWLVVPDPGTGGTRVVPPGGHVCGIYTRVDTARGIHKAPANEDIQGVVDVSTHISTAGNEILTTNGINAIRRFEGRGILVWGARTLSSDREWRYVSVRRLCLYLEASITDGLRWVVFEPNEASLWATIRAVVSDFLIRQWRAGTLQGTKPEQAFFVACGPETMTQDDIASGRLVCEFGVAPVRPAEFVIFRIVQSTFRDPP